MIKEQKDRWFLWGVIDNCGIETMPVTDSTGPQWVIRWSRQSRADRKCIFYSLEQRPEDWTKFRSIRKGFRLIARR